MGGLGFGGTGCAYHLAIEKDCPSLTQCLRKSVNSFPNSKRQGSRIVAGKGVIAISFTAESGVSLTLSGQAGGDAKFYQEKDVREAIKKAKGQ